MKCNIFTLLICVCFLFNFSNLQSQPYYYTPHIQSFITTYGCGGCHFAGGSSGFNQLTYAAILAGGVQCAPDVRPFDENGSPYVIKIDCSLPLTCGGSNMPYGNPCTVSASDIALVRAWIRGGALGDNTFCQSFSGSPLTIDFTGFAGGGFTSSPSTTQLNSKVWNFGGFSDFYKPGQSNTGNDFARGATTPGVPVTGGIYGCTYSTGNQALWLQPSTNDFSAPNGGSINLQLCNNSGSSITSLNISYDILVYNDRDRSSSFNFFYSTNGSTYTQILALDYTSPTTASVTPTVVTVPRSSTINSLNILNGEMFYLRWFGNDVSGSGERDELGIDNIIISIPGTCNITNVSATTPVCSSTSATFNVSFIQSGGSGNYNVINTANSSILASGSSSPISVTIPNSVGGNINVNIVDVSIPTCSGSPVSVTLPDCTPVCSISSVNATTATCNGTSAEFNVSFNVANGSGVYNVINTANNNILASGNASPIQVSIPNNLTAGNISINVTDASNPGCAGNPFVVALPDCTPPVFCGNNACDGTEEFCSCPADCDCVISAEFLNFDLSSLPVVSALPVAFCTTYVTGEVNPSLPHYLYVPLRVNGVTCTSYNLTSDEGSFYVLNANTLQSTATIGNMSIVWLRMSQGEINLAGGSTTINFSGSSGSCLTNKTITWSNVTNYTGNVATTCKAALTIRAFLTGAYNFTANDGLMRLNLNSLVPLNSPYSVSPWNAPSASVTSVPSDIVDWVLVELRTPLNDNLIESQAGLLASDGFVRNTSGHPGLTYAATGTFKVVVKHRNHVGIISSATIDPNGGVANLVSQANVNQGSNQLINLGDTGLFGLAPGDINSNGVVTYADYNAFINAGTMSNNYHPADCNMDGQVNLNDFNFMRIYFQQIGLSPIRN